MNYYIWTEGDREMGFGHVYRTLTLAEELPYPPRFLTKSDDSVVKKIEAGGFTVERIKDDDEGLRSIGSWPLGTVIIDRLEVEPYLAARIRNLGHRLVIFDNLSEANEHANVVVRVVGSDFRNRSWIDERTGTNYFIGPRYYIFKRSFFEHRGRKESGEDGRVLVLFGGTDPRHLTGPVFQELRSIQGLRRIDLVLGAGNVDAPRLTEDIKLDSDRIQVELHQDIGDVSVLMNSASLIITSPGMSMFESLFLGKKVIAFSQGSFHDDVFGKSFNLFHPEDVPRLREMIESEDVIDPSNEDIIGMEIGEGKYEVLKAITDLSSIKY